MTAVPDTSETPAVPALRAVRLTKHFPVGRGSGRGVVRAVDDVSLSLRKGSVVALVGESGSGKTTLAKMLSLYYPPTDGTVELEGTAVTSVTGRQARNYYGKVQLLFQDPFASLNSLKSIRHILGRAVKLHGRARGTKQAEDAVLKLLERVNLKPARDFIDKFPHELSGGQRQRIVIARALAVGPEVMLGDEPISMLDVSIRLNVLNLLGRLRDEEGLALLYITHDIASARYIADRVVVMYAGQVVEAGPTEDVIQAPSHPYTRLLLNSSPDPDRAEGLGREALFDVEDLGEPPDLTDPPTGCRFHPRCPVAMEVCRTSPPPELSATEPGAQVSPDSQGEASAQWARCWLLDPAYASNRSASPAPQRP
ncbi:ABC transporter ATP-binding protein [Streptomyces sp. NPDC005151]